MKNHELTRTFFQVTDAATKRDVLQNIADHYGITPEEAEVEVTAPEAEHLLDYITGTMRPATQGIMKRHRLA
jgi:hypothetical protein